MKFLTGKNDPVKTLDEVLIRVKNFFDQDATAEYEVSLGTDSQSFSRVTKYVTVIVIYKIGSGGILFRRNNYIKGRRPELHEKILKETTLTIEMAEEFIPKLKKLVMENSYNVSNIFADGDVSSTDGKSSVMRTTVEGMFTAYGLSPRTKPNAIAATYVADYFC